MIHNVDDVQVLNDAYANGYADCEKHHKKEWEDAAFYKGIGIGIQITTWFIIIVGTISWMIF